MKKIVLFLMVIFSFYIYPPLIGATPRTVTITWTMPDTTDVQGYKVYYADNSTMINKIWHSNCSSPIENPTNTFTVTCNNIDLANDQTYYFEVAAEITDGSEATSYAKSAVYNTIPPRITTVLNFKVVTSTTPTQLHSISFQPADAPIQEGFSVDSGLNFDVNRGYGWTSPPASWGTRDRDMPWSTDQSYDTLIFTSPTGVWEKTIGNGTYLVTICVGDAATSGAIADVQVEGHSLITHESFTSQSRWIKKEIEVEVTDGRLTVSFTGSDPVTPLCWIKIN